MLLRRLALLTLIPALSVLTPAAAHAETRTVRDTYNGSIPALNVKHGTYSYTQTAAVFRVKFEQLSKDKTVLAAHYLRRDGVTIQVVTKWVDGTKRLQVVRYDDTSYTHLAPSSVSAGWDFARDIITIRIPERLLYGNVASFDAWSQRKGTQEGGVHDEVYIGSLHRG